VTSSDDGEFIFFAQDAGQLRQVFQRVAEKILMQLTQ
jgi:hypothetical protein